MANLHLFEIYYEINGQGIREPHQGPEIVEGEQLNVLASCSWDGKIKIHDEVLKKGMKIPGVIIRPEQEITYNEDGFKEKHYYLYVKYVDSKTNEEKEFKTEELVFNPFKKLKSNKCNVYIYNETIIAEDFEIAKNKEERVFEDNNNFKPEKEIKKVDLITVLAIIMIVIASIIFICALLKKL